MQGPNPAPITQPLAADDVHQRLGQLTRQLHGALNELGYADQLRGTMGQLPDAQSRLSYIARLTGEAAEKVLGRVEIAKMLHDRISNETERLQKQLVADPVATVAKGGLYNYLQDIQAASREADAHLTEIMMAQDFHDLTGQVIARVVNLAATIEEQLVQLLIQTAPPNTAAQTPTPTPRDDSLQGPVVDPGNATEVVTSQSQVDDLLASLGF